MPVLDVTNRIILSLKGMKNEELLDSIVTVNERLVHSEYPDLGGGDADPEEVEEDVKIFDAAKIEILSRLDA